MNEEPDSPSNRIVTETPGGTGSRKGRKALSAEEFSDVLDTVAGGKEQDPHALTGARDSMLEVAIGREVRAFRNKLGITASGLAKAAGLDGLKGHRSVGGMRASIYNAFPQAGVERLVEVMRDFELGRS